MHDTKVKLDNEVDRHTLTVLVDNEAGVLARLRHQRFFSLAELNAAITALVEDLNARPMRKLGVSRRQLFEQLDQPALSSLPSEPFVYAEWRICRVSLDYQGCSTLSSWTG